MQNVTVICSMLHEDDATRVNSATRTFRGEPVLSWTLRRICRSQRIGNIAVLCWEDQLAAVEEIAAEHHAYVLAKGPRQRIGTIEEVAAARRWSDGWRGGLLGTCDFDLGFHAPWIKELSDRTASDAVVLVDPAAALVDPAIIDQIIAHAADKPQIELCFTQAAPGLAGMLLRPALLDKLATTRLHPGRMLHYMPQAPARDPIGTELCAPVASPVARSTRSFKLDSDRQAARIALAAQDLNGELLASDSEQIVQRLQWPGDVDQLPREITIELNTARRCSPIFSPVRHLEIKRGASATIEDWDKLLREAASADDLRLTIAGAGDPLESDLLFPLIENATRAGVRAIHVHTDLLCEHPRRIEQLAASAIDVVSVNIPAMSAQTYESIMGVDGFKRVLDNVAAFVRARASAGSTLPILVPTFVKCAQNLAEMEAWYDQWLGTIGCAVIDGPNTFAGQIPDHSLAVMSPPLRKACLRLASRISVLSDGRYVPCEQDVQGSASIGNIRDDSLCEIWSRRLAPLRANHGSGKWDCHSLCGACREWHRP